MTIHIWLNSFLWYVVYCLASTKVCVCSGFGSSNASSQVVSRNSFQLCFCSFQSCSDTDGLLGLLTWKTKLKVERRQESWVQACIKNTVYRLDLTIQLVCFNCKEHHTHENGFVPALLEVMKVNLFSKEWTLHLPLIQNPNQSGKLMIFVRWLSTICAFRHHHHHHHHLLARHFLLQYLGW